MMDTRLGVRQKELLRFASTGDLTLSHSSQGRMQVFARGSSYGIQYTEAQVERLADLGLVDYRQNESGSRTYVVLTDAGKEALRA